MFKRRWKSAALATAVCGSLLAFPFSQQTDKLTDDSLKSMLDNMGYSPSKLTSGYLITIKRDTWTYYLNFVISSDQSKIGINANLGTVEKPEEVTAEEWRKVLEANENTDPSFFYFDKDNKKLYLHRVLDNRGIDPAFLRGQVDAFVGNIHDSADAWKFTK